MRFITIISMIACSNWALALSSCDGFWIAKYKDLAKGWDTTAELTINGNEAKWKATLGMHDKKGSPCRDYTFPAKVLQCTDSEIEFKVDGSEIASPRAEHYPNWHVSLNRLEADQAEGIFVKQQIPLTIVRINR